MPLRPSAAAITKYRKRWFSSSSKHGSLTTTTTSLITPESEDDISSPLTHCPPEQNNPTVATIPHPDIEDPTTTSILSLPVELLREIFLWSTKPDLVTFDQHSAPVSLSHTCYVWRQLAIGMPHLWNVIYIDYSPPRYPTRRLLQLWMERANGLPLFLTLGTRTMHRDDDSPHSQPSSKLGTNIQAAIELLLHHAPQWQNLWIGGDISQQLSPCFLRPNLDSELDSESSSSTVLKFSSLQHCHWVISPYSSGSINHHLTDQNFEALWTTLQSSAPHLQSAQLCKVPKNAPWTQLRSIVLCGTPFFQGAHALPQCTNLEFLHWTIEKVNPYIRWHISPFTIPRLTRLNLAYRTENELIPLFNAIRLPCLTRLDLFILDHWRGDNGPLPSELIGMLSHLNHPLQQFSFRLLSHHPLSDSTTITPILLSSCFHGLKRLALSAITDIAELSTMISSPVNFPSLTDLDVGVVERQHHRIRLPKSLMHALQKRSAQSHEDDDGGGGGGGTSTRITHLRLYHHITSNRDRESKTCLQPVSITRLRDINRLPGVKIYLQHHK